MGKKMWQNINIWEIWVKIILELSMLLSQHFAKSEIITK